jgi:transposase InsO family protein
VNETPNLSRTVEWARKGLCPWRTPRKVAVKLLRGGKSRPWVARAMGESVQWVSKWDERFRDGGKHWSALEDRSRRPHRIHARRHAHVEAVLSARAEFPHLGPKKLQIVAGIPLGHDAIARVLREHRLAKAVKRHWYQYRRFQRPFPNYLWQLDFKEFFRSDGRKVWAANVIDDCSRFILASRCLDQAPTGADAIAVVAAAIRLWGKPLQVLTDRGPQFSGNHRQDHPSPFTQWLDHRGIRHIRARPYHPQTCGKIERWHGSLNREWFAHQLQPSTLAQAQDLLDRWVVHYNTVRPHQALGYRVPVEVYCAGLTMDEELLRLVNEVSR